MKGLHIIIISAFIFSIFTGGIVSAETPMWSYECNSDGDLVATINQITNGTTNTSVLITNTISNSCSIMSSEIYIMFELMAVAFLILGIIRKRDETTESALIFPAIATLLFLMLALLGGSIDRIPNISAMQINLGLGFVALVHLLYVIFYSGSRAIGVDIEEGDPNQN